jgi:hypothetical protein
MLAMEEMGGGDSILHMVRVYVTPSGFSGGCRGEGHKAGSLNHIDKIYKGLVAAAALFIFFLFKFRQNHYSHTVHSSISIAEASLHFFIP